MIFSLGGILDIIPAILIYFVNLVTSLVEWIQVWFFQYPMMTFRYFTHASDHETFYILMVCFGAIMGLGYWVADATGMFNEVVADAAAAPATS